MAAWLDNAPAVALTALAKAKKHGETPLDLALTAWALRQTQAATAAAARERALNTAKQHPSDRWLKEVLERP